METYVVKSLQKISKKKYLVEINLDSYILQEDTVLKFRLVEGKIVHSLEEVLQFDKDFLDISKYRNYLAKYLKTEKEFIEYLKSKGLSDQLIDKYVCIFKEEKLLNDELIARSRFTSLENRSYGINYIKKKFYEYGLASYFDELKANYNPPIDKLLIKEIKKLAKFDGLEEKKKLYNNLIRKGYLSSEFDKLYERYLELKDI